MFRIGDFYDMFYDGAITTAREIARIVIECTTAIIRPTVRTPRRISLF